MKALNPQLIPSSAYQKLLDAINGEKGALPDWWGRAEAAREVFEKALENEVASLLAHRLADVVGWEALPDDWRRIHEETFQRISAYLVELDRVAARLAEEDIPLVALKNGGIARGIYPCPGCVPMGDLDVLIEKSHFRKAHEILIEEGYHFEFRSPLEKADLNGAEASGGAEYWKILPDGRKLWFELQWRPVAGRWIQPNQEPPADELIVRSISIPDSAVRLLAPEDNLLQVALHTAKHTYVRAPGFRFHLDVERIVCAYPNLDWKYFVEQVQKLRVKTAVYFSLMIPHELFETPIPDTVLATLRPPAWKEGLMVRWLGRVGLFNPKEKKFSKPGYILFNMLLYDDFRGLLWGIFPSREWMKQRYGFHNKWLLPWYHLKRLFNLTLKRTNT